MFPSSGSTPDSASKKSIDQQLNRACESCRLSKVRCLMDPVSGSSQCQRCAKAGRTCVFAPPAKRRQRKRTDVRVAELEKEVRQMRSLLRTNRISPVEASDNEPESAGEESDEPEEHVVKESPTYTTSHPIYPPTAIFTEKSCPNDIPDDSKLRQAFGSADLDIVERGFITMEMAEDLLGIYRNELVVACPGVVVPSDWTAADLRTKKPALFHAVMAAASHCKGSELSNQLHEEVVYLYARSLFIKGEKALQYVQALLITVAFYTPPNTPSQLQIYQWGNMAASMALELGLASKPRTHEQLPKRAIKSLQRISSAEELLEHCRTILVLYVMTAGFAMRLRRPSILIYNSWMEECMSLMQQSPLLDDRRVVAWVKLQRIADEAMTAFGFDDASTSFSLSELRLQVILRVFERRMQDWQKSIPSEVMTMSLTIEYHQNMCSMFEFAMDGGRYDAPEFKNRHFSLPALDDDSVQPEALISRSALQINATIRVISHAHALLDHWLELPAEALQKAPTVLFVRPVYAIVALLRADYAVGLGVEGMGGVLDSQSLKVDSYLNNVIQRVSAAIGPQKCRVPSHWLFVLNHKLKMWHDEHQAWRKEGRKPIRSLPLNCKGAKEPAEHNPIPFGGPKPQETVSASATAPNQPMPPAPLAPATTSPGPPGTGLGTMPNFGVSSAYSSWPANTGLSMTSTDGPQPQLPADLMTDFSSAFQNGDLYLWNDVNDNFGGWVPQGGSIYSDMQFGAMNSGY
ncbi:hypothetical protein BCR34DRAFT_481476 [Clohesyomyces aquaticus]|uniref:Zn(2)-C6 fungal-type domain-containing protein n=1 Tax=Clohesyomyces aquaticus TaxID=1231657 RepID=A0A1Y1ZSG9_9PLEO|nr:hypothetical protein BCR34DRAFT_481476 [Clohesyomyces aquaticus]